MRVNPCIGAQLTATAHRQPTYSSLHHCHHYHDHHHHHHHHHYDQHQHNHDHDDHQHDHDHHAYIFWDNSDPLVGDRNVLHENG